MPPSLPQAAEPPGATAMRRAALRYHSLTTRALRVQVAAGLEDPELLLMSAGDFQVNTAASAGR